jgi:hypothetical protein
MVTVNYDRNKFYDTGPWSTGLVYTSKALYYPSGAPFGVFLSGVSSLHYPQILDVAGKGQIMEWSLKIVV